MAVQLIGGKYLLGELIGQGGMGRIYAAEDLATGRTVAVKLLHPRLTCDPTMVRRLIDEAEATGRVTHPNVIRVLDHGTLADDAPFLVMERVRGTPLGILIRDHGPLPQSRVGRISQQLLAGLSAIHRAGMVHGDVKSDNLLVDPQIDDHVTIIDLGVARALASMSRLDDERVLTGTPEYMAPEVIRGELPGLASDLYGVGVILYEMVTGTTPFGGGTAADIFDRHLAEPLVPPSKRCPDCRIAPAIERLICLALEKTADARPASAARLALALQRAMPATYEHDADPVRSAAKFSTSGDTADWVRPTLKQTAPWHRRASPIETPPAGSRT